MDYKVWPLFISMSNQTTLNLNNTLSYISIGGLEKKTSMSLSSTSSKPSSFLVQSI